MWTSASPTLRINQSQELPNIPLHTFIFKQFITLTEQYNVFCCWSEFFLVLCHMLLFCKCCIFVSHWGMTLLSAKVLLGKSHCFLTGCARSKGGSWCMSTSVHLNWKWNMPIPILLWITLSLFVTLFLLHLVLLVPGPSCSLMGSYRILQTNQSNTNHLSVCPLSFLLLLITVLTWDECST